MPGIEFFDDGLVSKLFAIIAEDDPCPWNTLVFRPATYNSSNRNIDYEFLGMSEKAVFDLGGRYLSSRDFECIL